MYNKHSDCAFVRNTFSTTTMMAAQPRLDFPDSPDVVSEDRDTLTDSTDESNDDDFDDGLPQMTGTLNKWTNYLHGWQERFIVLKDGTLTYFKSETDKSFGCRGAVSLARAMITPHPVDECRFDISVNDNVWYLRVETEEDRSTWINALELHRQAESGYGSLNSLKRQGSLLSITSGTSISNASASSFKRGRGLVEKLAEMETFRDILCRQVDTLQGYFDACTQALSVIQTSVHDMDHDVDQLPDDVKSEDRPVPTNPGKPSNTFSTCADSEVDPSKLKDLAAIFQQHGAHAIDFKGEAITFKATTAGIIATLSHCMELMGQREETWKKRLEKEVEKRKKIEELYKSSKGSAKRPIVIGGPDYEEGPTCVINEEEFFDAVDASLDKLELEAQRSFEKSKEKIIKHPPKANTPGAVISLPSSHSLTVEVNAVVEEHLKYANMNVDNSVWEIIHDEGEMKVFRREMEENGMIVDPMKAVHTVTGVTGHELCHYFWDTSVRMEWEGTLESSRVVEVVSDDTVITHQAHKKVWPTTQRDALFWSHIRHVSSNKENTPDFWIVCNYSTDDPKAPPGKCVRVKLNVAMICETTIASCAAGPSPSRDDLTCKIQYAANVNPGGWAPPSVLRAVYKREYPKFLKRFTQYVKDSTVDKPIMF